MTDHPTPAGTADTPAGRTPAGNSASVQTTPAAHSSGGHISTGELVQQAAEQMSRLVRDEIKLAQVELTRKSTRLAKGGGIIGGSSVIAIYGVGCLLIAAIAGLATVVAAWLSALIVGAVLFACAGITALIGKRQIGLAAPLVPEQTVESVKADAETISERARR
jgi:hypothetical protein